MNEPVAIERWDVPVDATRAAEILKLLAHKGSPWIEDIQRRLLGQIPGAGDRFFVARVARQLVGHVWYSVARNNPSLGLIGHIYCTPEHRRRGIARRLIELAMDDFRQRGGAVMQLFTSTPYTLPFYQRLGFANFGGQSVYHDMDWYMCYPADGRQRIIGGRTAAYGALRPLSAADLPAYCLLYNLEHETVLKDWAQRIGTGLEAEWAFVTSWPYCSAGQGVCMVLEDGGMLVGLASLMRLPFAHQSHVGAMDVYVCDSESEDASMLVEACLSRREQLGIEFVYGASVDQAKSDLLRRLGFLPRGVGRGHYRVAKRSYDLQLFQYGVGSGGK